MELLERAPFLRTLAEYADDIELYHNPDGKVYCLLEGPDEDAVRKHHAALGVLAATSTRSPALPDGARRAMRLGYRVDGP